MISAFIKPQKDNICGIIVTYHPDDDFHQRVSAIVDQVNHVIIVDNASGPNVQELLGKLGARPNITSILNQENLGIAAAMNQGFEWAQENNYAWVLTLDQDCPLLVLILLF